MLSIIRWIGKQFRYFFYGKDEIIAKINDEQNNIPNDVRTELIQSVIQNKPDRFIKKINESTKISEHVKTDLMKSVMVKPYVENSETQRDVENVVIVEDKKIDNDVNKTDNEMYSINDKKNYEKKFIKQKMDIKIPRHSLVEQIIINTHRMKDWKKTFDHSLSQLKLRKFIAENTNKYEKQDYILYVDKNDPTRKICEVITTQKPQSRRSINRDKRYHITQLKRDQTIHVHTSSKCYNRHINHGILRMEHKWNQYY